MRTALALAIAIVVGLSGSALADHHQCRCLAIAADLPGAIQVEVARADGLYARGDFGGALAIYARLHATVKEPSLLYAQAMVKWQLGANADARALFQAYLAAGGNLAYRDLAEAGLRDLGAGVSATVGTAVGAVGAVGGAVGGMVRGGVDGGLGIGKVTAKPKKLAKGAAVVLGVVAVAAIAAVGIHGIAAGLKDDIELDAKFDLGLGLTGVTVGITAFYVGGLTAAAGAVGGVNCASLPKRKPIVAPIALHGGGGLVTAMSF